MVEAACKLPITPVGVISEWNEIIIGEATVEIMREEQVSLLENKVLTSWGPTPIVEEVATLEKTVPFNNGFSCFLREKKIATSEIKITILAIIFIIF